MIPNFLLFLNYKLQKATLCFSGRPSYELIHRFFYLRYLSKNNKSTGYQYLTKEIDRVKKKFLNGNNLLIRMFYNEDVDFEILRNYQQFLENRLISIESKIDYREMYEKIKKEHEEFIKHAEKIKQHWKGTRNSLGDIFFQAFKKGYIDDIKPRRITDMLNMILIDPKSSDGKFKYESMRTILREERFGARPLEGSPKKIKVN